MKTSLHIRLLGDFSLIYADRQVTALNAMRLQSLLAYLVLHRDIPQPRQHLAFLFWSDTTEAQARNNLRQLLYQLRQVFPPVDRFLSADTHMLHWQPVIPFHCDVVDFEEALARADAARQVNDQPALQAALEQADSLYRGDLLPGCYDEWILPERERLRQRHLQALEQLLRLFEAQGDIVTAIGYARRLLTLDPLSEDLYRRLMHLHTLNNDRASALHVYHTCVLTLQREMGVDPAPATREAYERIMQQETPAIQLIAHQPPPTAAPALIGREREWEQLYNAWQYSTDSGPHFVLVTGEAGVGKSRLAEEFLLWASRKGAATAKARSYAAEGQLSLAPVTEWLRSDALRASLRQLDEIWLIEVARILPELFAERPDLPHYESVTEYGQRQRFFEALARAILLAPRPALLLLDDVQWSDQETLAWLHFLLRFDPAARLLVIGCARAEELPPQHPLYSFLLHLRNTMGMTEIALKPLDAAETAKLAAQVAKRELALDEGLRLFHETGGYPLFVVEMVRANLSIPADNEHSRAALRASQLEGKDQEHLAANPQEGSGLQWQAPFDEGRTLPPRVQAVLAGRLLQLSDAARRFVELAATIGREFTLDLLIAAGNTDVESAVRALDELWHKRIIREHGANGYDFTHDKLREVAYGEISAPQRRLLHHRVAQALEAMYAEDLDSISGQLASHYERAGMIEQALPCYQRAAAVAQRVYANEDAISLLSRSLELLNLMPAGMKRDKQELGLLLALAPLYRVTRGWAAPELEHLLNRALALCDTVGNDAQRAQTLYGLQSVYVVQGKLEKVHIVSDELNILYRRSLGTAPPPFADMMLAGVRLHLGRIIDANAQLAEVIAAHDPDQILHIQESQGSNYAAHARAWQAHALWCLGYPQQALQRALEAVKLVQDLGQPFNQALVSAYLALLQQLRADQAVAREHAEHAHELTSRYQAPYYHAWADILLSYSLALEQPDEEHIQRLRGSITAFKASSARLRLPYYLSLLARVYQKAGRAEEGLACIDEALSEARTYNERWWDAELHRLRGELLLMHGADASDAEAALLRSIEVARSQQARSLELRATMSLTRLWIAQHRSDEAKRRLEHIYNWFTEGFETPDLQAARRLLAQL